MSALTERWWLVLDLALLLVLLVGLVGYALGWDAAWRLARDLRRRERAFDHVVWSLRELCATLRTLHAALEGTPPDGSGSGTPEVAEVRVVERHPPPDLEIDLEEHEREEARIVPPPAPWWANGGCVETSP